uniref:TF-B3 domain-containing protein n=1 Tax=Cannabis sativa TaxID=3483 RepID=A0A803Q5I7_CANSA
MEFESTYKISRTFPDELLKDSVRVVKSLKDKLRWLSELETERNNNFKDVSMFVMADTAYGSCCVDEVGASHIGADCVVHYGHACLSPTTKLPAFFVFGKAPMSVSDCVKNLTDQATTNNKRVLVVPFSFAKNHLLSVSKHEDVILKVQDERIWPVRFYYRKYTGRSQFRFDWGWKAFARDNDLKVGDICVFVKRQNIGIMLFEVVTFYKNGVPNSLVLPAANNRTPCVKVKPSFTSNNYDNASMISHDIISKKEVIEPSYKVCGESPEPENFIRNQELSRKEKDEAFKRVKDFKSEDPFFIVPMQPSFVGSKSKYCMGMPSLFGKKYLVGTSNSPQDVILKVQDGRTWCVKYYVKPLGTSSKATIEGGWKAFVQDNELKVGDVCAFVLRNIIGIISFEVVIFHGNGVATSCMLPIPGKQEL